MAADTASELEIEKENAWLRTELAEKDRNAARLIAENADLRRRLELLGAVDPRPAERLREEARLRAAAPLRGKKPQAECDAGLFAEPDLFGGTNPSPAICHRTRRTLVRSRCLSARGMARKNRPGRSTSGEYVLFAANVARRLHTQAATWVI
jgi:hypothetical protein